MAAIGEHISSIPREKTEVLIRESCSINFLELMEIYGPSECAGCSVNVLTFIDPNGKAKTVRHVTGVEEVPPKLQALERMIDDIIAEKGWLNTTQN